VLKSARYLGDVRRIEFGEIYAFVGDNYIVTVCHGENSVLDEVRRQMEDEPDQLLGGPPAIFCEVLHHAVEGYGLVVEDLESAIDDVETEVFEGPDEASRRIHALFRQVIPFHQATKPLATALERLTEEDEDLDLEARRSLRRVRDNTLRVTEQVEGFRDLLFSILDANLTMVSVQQTQVGVQQTNQAQKISAWAAVLAVPTIIAGIFGMNLSLFSDLEPLKDYFWIDFWLTLVLMALVSALLYWRFKRSGWL
jgi:magnesium transporter